MRSVMFGRNYNLLASSTASRDLVIQINPYPGSGFRSGLLQKLTPSLLCPSIYLSSNMSTHVDVPPIIPSPGIIRGFTDPGLDHVQDSAQTFITSFVLEWLSESDHGILNYILAARTHMQTDRLDRRINSSISLEVITSP